MLKQVNIIELNGQKLIPLDIDFIQRNHIKTSVRVDNNDDILTVYPENYTARKNWDELFKLETSPKENVEFISNKFDENEWTW